MGMWRLFHARNEDMGLGIDPMPRLGVPLLFNGAQAVCQFLLAEQLITGPFALLQLLPDLVDVHSRIALHRMRVQRVKSRLRAHGEQGCCKVSLDSKEYAIEPLQFWQRRSVEPLRHCSSPSDESHRSPRC